LDSHGSTHGRGATKGLQAHGLDLDFLKAALDEEERSRLEVDEGQALILINIPIMRSKLVYVTLPLGIIIVKTT